MADGIKPINPFDRVPQKIQPRPALTMDQVDMLNSEKPGEIILPPKTNKEKFNPTCILEIKNEDPKYKEFISEFWKTGMDDLHAIHNVGVSYSQLQEWKMTAEFKEHEQILIDYKVGRLEQAQFRLGSTGDNRSAEFILANLSDKYKKKKPKDDNSQQKSMSALVTKLQENGELDAE